MNKVIYLVTTKGCCACRRQKSILLIALKDREDIELEVCDFTELPEWLQVNVCLTDFPVTIFVEDDIIKYHFTGTKSVGKIFNIIKDIEF